MTRLSYHYFWAKTGAAGEGALPPYHLLPYHGLDVAAVAQVLLERDDLLRQRCTRMLGIEEEAAICLICFLIALHDNGKFAEGFQNLCPELFCALRGRESNCGYPVRHDTLGHLMWKDVLFQASWEQDWFGLRAFADDRYDCADYFDPLMRAIAGHHGMPPRTTKPGDAGEHFDEAARDAALEYAGDCRKLLLRRPVFSEWDYSWVDRARKASWLLAGITVLADWIGSNWDFFTYCDEPLSLERYWRKRALPQAQEALVRTGVLGGAPVQETGFEVLFPHFDEPTPLQAHAAEEAEVGAGPQLFILEDTTGAGKTEGAIILTHRIMAAGGARGLYIGLPTMATANAMYERLAGAYRRLFSDPEQASLVLAHSKRHLDSAFRASVELAGSEDPTRSYDSKNRDKTGEAQCAIWLTDSRKKALLATVGVGTVDQALIGVLPSLHQSLRLLGAGRNVLIVDEVHAYDTYMHELLQRLLTFQAAQGGSAILLSATLPHEMRQELCDAFRAGLGYSPEPVQKRDFPLVTRGGEQVKEVPVAHRPDCERSVKVEPFSSERKVKDQLVSEARAGRCACWIRNTVDDAVRAYGQLVGELGPERVGLFHSRFALCDRQVIEKRALSHFGEKSGVEERRGRLLVATQVVEQSLDLDFDYMVSDLAPIDLLIQRVGREQRHVRNKAGNRLREQGAEDERDGPVLGILMPPFTESPAPDWYSQLFPKARYVYPHVGQLWLTARVLHEEGEITIPKRARHLIECVYSAEAQAEIPDALREATRQALEEEKLRRATAGVNALKLEDGYGGPQSMRQWQSDETVPTRLGEPTTTVRLGRHQNGRITPWAEGDNAWQRSEVSVRASKLAGEAALPPDEAHAARRAHQSMPDEGQWSVLVPLRPEREGQWSGRATDEEGVPVEARYSTRTGLKVNTLH